MKLSNSKLFRKIANNRKSNQISELIKNKTECEIKPVPEWWKARNVKDTI